MKAESRLETVLKGGHFAVTAECGPPKGADPEVIKALETSGVNELRRPTLGDGETYNDLLADRSAFEDFDPDVAASRGYGFVRLNQLAIEHLMGAR